MSLSPPRLIRPENSESRKGRFVHEPAVLAQVEHCRKLPPSKLFRRLTNQSDTQNKVCEECLVMLVRDFQSRGMDAIAWKLVDVLAERVSLSIGRAVRLWSLAPLESEEVIESVISVLYDSVLDTSDRGRFWEIRFWVCFDRLLLSTVRAQRLKSSRVIVHESAELHGTVIDESGRESKVKWSDPALRAVVAEALSKLPEKVRTAFMLKHWAGFAEYSNDPNDRATISTVMGVSDRTVRNYLARAELLLNEWRAESDSAA